MRHHPQDPALTLALRVLAFHHIALRHDRHALGAELALAH